MKHASTLTLLAILGTALPSLADVTLPAVFGNHMILQRDTPQHVWGTAEAGEKITVTFDRHSETITADADGNWLSGLPSMPSDGGKAHQLTVKGKNKIVLNNILIGDVWIGSGQSNMEWPLKKTDNGKEFCAGAKHAGIRLFHIAKTQTNQPAKDVKASWKECTPENIPNFSAVLYHFGKEIHKEVNVPIGLINSSWGGSPIEPWIVTKTSSGKMYNGMIAPITKFPVRGTIWYQGETNVINKNGLSYGGKMKDLILGWRDVFDNKEMPFYFVQIAPWGNKRYADGQLPALWEAQTATLKIPNTGMAVTTDLVSNIGDIHPRNKHDVGNRLARWALAKNYGKKDVIYSGPIFKAMKVKGNKIHLSFAHASGGLKSRDGKPLSEFTIAGADGKFVAAQAEIDGKTVVVSAKDIKSPKQVRFGWHRSTNPNLTNAEGLPTSPFQTNNWTGGTGE
ncbi:MAG: sialate O-acetylesterase [Akkermansiaceae bacterium]|jgi:sialate O-acetylesterase|tara:strand:- start:9637 stop:10992 length:1356 start_codon:yes stop_codon:yes gene_type:complete